MFISPLFYPVSALPPKYQLWLHLNPLTLIIEQGRNVLIFGNPPNWLAWWLALAGSLLIAAGGFCLVSKDAQRFCRCPLNPLFAFGI